jgi:hypothetical protein
VGTKLYLPSYPSMGKGLQPAFRQHPGGEKAFAAFEINFHNMTVDQAPSVGELAVDDPVYADPYITSDLKSGDAYETLVGSKNRCLVVQTKTTWTKSGWAFDMQEFGVGVSLPQVGWRVEYYVATTNDNGNDARLMQSNLFVVDVNNFPSNTGIYMRCESSYIGTVGEGLWTRKDGVSSGGPVTDDGGGSPASNHWTRFRAEFIGADRTVQMWMKGIQQGGDIVGAVKDLPNEEDFPYPDFRWLMLSAQDDAFWAGTKVHSVWVGNLADSFPATYG